MQRVRSGVPYEVNEWVGAVSAVYAARNEWIFADISGN